MDKLLDAVRTIREKYDAIYKSNGSYFNIFRIVNIDTDEVRICRILKELLDPYGAHYQGDIYLRLFVKHVLTMEQEFTDADYAAATVQRELMIKNDRRIDLFIEIGDKKIPIEVKIYAGDQYEQCQDYFVYAVNSKIFYLTLDGHAPSKESIGNLPPDCIQPISFRNDIITWLNACLNTPGTIRIAPIREIILQVIDILKILTGQSEEGLELDIQTMIMSSKENLQNADMIQKVMQQVELEMKTKIFLALDEHIERKYQLKRLPNSRDFSQQTSKSNPGINYLIRKLNLPNHELWLRVEIDSRDVYAGLYIVENNENTPSAIQATKDLRQTITDGSLSGSAWWVAWKYLHDHDGKRPDFRTHNDAYYSLADAQSFERFIESAMSDIDDVINSLKSPYREAVVPQATP